MTRFKVEIMPKDGGRHRTLYADHDLVLCPSVGDSFMLWDGMTVEVHSVDYAPTMDPAVWVRGRSLFPKTTAEADEIVKKATREEGWMVFE